MNRAPSPSDACPGCGIRYAQYRADLPSEAEIWDSAARLVWGYNPKTEQLGAIEAGKRETGAFVAGVQCDTEWRGYTDKGGQGIHPDVLNHVRESTLWRPWAEHKRRCRESSGQSPLDSVPFDVGSTLRDRAEGWLVTHLGLGAVPARDVIAAAKEAGIGKRTLDYAKRAIGVQVERQSTGNRGRGCWYWHLPESQRERVAA